MFNMKKMKPETTKESVNKSKNIKTNKSKGSNIKHQNPEKKNNKYKPQNTSKKKKLVPIREINLDIAQKFYLKNKENLKYMYLSMGFEDTVYTPIVENGVFIRSPKNVKEMGIFKGTTKDIPCIYYGFKDGKKGIMACYNRWDCESNINIDCIHREELGSTIETPVFEPFKKTKYEKKDGCLIRLK